MHVSFFTSPHADTITSRDLSLPDLATLIQTTTAASKPGLPWLKLATFGDRPTPRGSLRNNANVLSISGIEADYDGESVTPEQAADRLTAAGLEALLYTSPSHLPDFPRWRVLCPCSCPQPPSSRADMVARLNHVLGGGLAVESFTLSQAYYLGFTPDSLDHRTIITTGRPIDQHTGPTLYPARGAADPIILPMPPPGQTPDERTRQALDVAMAAFSAPDDAAGRHQTLLSATNTVAPFILSGHLDVSEAEDQISAAMSGSGRDPNPGEVAGALTGACRMARPYIPQTHGAEFPPAPPLAVKPISLEEITEDNAARKFAERMHRHFRFDHSDQRWYAFDPAVGWSGDPTDRVLQASRDFLLAARTQWGITNKEALKAASIGFATAVIRGCRSDPRMATTAAEWDTDLNILGVPGGCVDLSTGTTHRADPERLQRRRTAVAPVPGPCPVWRRFLHEATGGDAQLEAWLHRMAGYFLTGDVSEEMLAFVYGPGRNGKGVFLRTLSAILGTYAYQAPAELLKSDSRINRESHLAKLEGVRLVLVSETEAGAMMAESLVKELTGNEGAINARHLYGRPFEFRTQAKILIVGNHAPALNGRSEAMERRLRVVPFDHKPPNPDPYLKDRLVAEYPAILAWMIEGHALWSVHRLGMCPAIQRASAAYFDEQDMLAQWFAERCQATPDGRAASSVLLEDYNAWLRQRGERPTHARDFKASFITRFPKLEWKHTREGSAVFGVNIVSDFIGMVA